MLEQLSASPSWLVLAWLAACVLFSPFAIFFVVCLPQLPLLVVRRGKDDTKSPFIVVEPRYVQLGCKYRREATVSAISFRPVSESSGSPFPNITPQSPSIYPSLLYQLPFFTISPLLTAPNILFLVKRPVTH
ncbi:hypothetical protein EVAR_63331_1 [Eumeta japonica]|uniref:Uncharacterized protein n=1 Tax=Eumeta variegata TaxID=151549 RepID=A0A4C1YQ19_EUMVA|nr:hypothetical protein EVAR_63331_1 [Eumeta japonica]